jgi:hypothetical protein
MTKAVDPFDGLASINPQVPSLVAFVRQILQQPFANRTGRNTEVFREFCRPIQHW